MLISLATMLENTAQAIGTPPFDLQKAMQHLSACDEKLAELIVE